jgi:hypothetical protein
VQIHRAARASKKSTNSSPAGQLHVTFKSGKHATSCTMDLLDRQKAALGVDYTSH